MNEINIKIPFYKYIKHNFNTKNIILDFSIKKFLNIDTILTQENISPYETYNPDNIYKDIDTLSENLLLNFNILNNNYIYVSYFYPIDIDYKIITNPFAANLNDNYYFSLKMNNQNIYPILTDITDLINLNLINNNIFEELTLDQKYKFLNKFIYLLSKKNRIFLLNNFVINNIGNDIGFIDTNSFSFNNYNIFQDPINIMNINQNYLDMIKELITIYKNYNIENEYNIKITSKFISDRLKEFEKMIHITNIKSNIFYQLLYLIPSLCNDFQNFNIDNIDDLINKLNQLWIILNSLKNQNMIYIEPNKSTLKNSFYLFYSTINEDYFNDLEVTNMEIENPLEKLIDYSKIKSTNYLDTMKFNDISGKEFSTPVIIQRLEIK